MDIVIRKDDDGLSVWVGDKTTFGGLTVGEVIEQVLSLIDYNPKSPIYRMMTEKEWADRRAEKGW